jgi:hypothetical protein
MNPAADQGQRNARVDDRAARGAALAAESDTQAPADQAKSKSSGGKLIDNPWAVLGAIFFAMMFLGIPLLWMSRGFSLPGKIFWSIVTLIYSALIIGLFGLVMWYCYQSIVSALGY